MTRMRLAVNVTITVLATLVIGAIGYGAMATQSHRAAAVAQAVPTPIPVASPVALPSPTDAPSGLIAIDQDMLSSSIGWMLLTDCPDRNSKQCHYATARTDDSGYTWTSPVQLGAEFSPSDGGAPGTIRFVNQQDGFVYGGSGAYTTHDGGATWQRADLPGFIGTIAIGPPLVWETDYPCAKGTLCQYEIRSSSDGGRIWSDPHKLPLNFSPETIAAFAQGVVMSSVPAGDIVITVDNGQTWRAIKSPCTGNPFRGRVATFDGSELWELCLGYPSDAGVVTDRSLFVSADGGKTWSSRPATQVASTVASWVVSNSLHQALASGDRASFITHDGGKTWAPVAPAFVNLSRIFFLTPTFGAAMDSDRNVLETFDGGSHWQDAGALPSRLS
jgi:photosystem II stability/assembly factor-like uncharacterized protein